MAATARLRKARTFRDSSRDVGTSAWIGTGGGACAANTSTSCPAPSAAATWIAGFTSLDTARERHVGSSPRPERYDPEAWTSEAALLARPGQARIQADLFYDYRTNVERYAEWQAWMRAHRPPTLILWGRYDPSFAVEGASAYARDLPDAEIHILEAGHFATDEAVDDVAAITRDFLSRL